MDIQESITLRDIEYVYQAVKLVTTNIAISKTSLYHPNNVFIINKDNLYNLPTFLKTNMEPLPASVLNNHTLDAFISEITQ